MGYTIKSVDIAKVKCDVIVNSLGLDPTIFGRVCSSIVSAAKSNELLEEIQSWKSHNHYGKIYTTSGYKLPAKHIIHVVTPLFKNDVNLYKLEAAYTEVLLKAFNNKWKNIALPIIGTGSNGYPHTYVVKMLTALVDAFTKEFPDINVTICSSTEKRKILRDSTSLEQLSQKMDEFFRTHKSYEIRDFEYHPEYFRSLLLPENENYDFELLSNFKSSSRKDPSGCMKMSLMVEATSTGSAPPLSCDEVDALLDGGVRPVDFDMTELSKDPTLTKYINLYLLNRYPNVNARKMVERKARGDIGGINNASSLKVKHDFKESRTKISMQMLMRYILAFHMNRKEADNLLLFCGKVFSPVSKEDRIYTLMIEKKIYNLNVANDYCEKEHIGLIFDYDEARPSKRK